MSTDEILGGLALVLVLAVSSQLVARRLRIPAIVVLLPAGFAAGATTDDVQPDALLGSLYQPFVTLAVGVILFEAGLRLSARTCCPGSAAVARLVGVGGLITWLGIAARSPAVRRRRQQPGRADRRRPGGLGPDRGAAAAGAHPPGRGCPLAAQVGGRAGRPDRRAAGRAGAARRQVERPPRPIWVPGELFFSLAVGAAVGAAAAAILCCSCARCTETPPLCRVGDADDGGRRRWSPPTCCATTQAWSRPP